MISYIRGQLASVEEDKVIVDVGGVGYGIYMSTHSMSLLPSAGNEVKLHTYLNVKEEAMQLFGFLTRDDLQVFKLLIGVSGIGPKGGQSILSVLSPDDLRFAVAAGDVKAIQAAPGIGKKTAEELKAEYESKLKEVNKEADAILAEARKKAMVKEADILEEARAEAARIIERANRQIELDRKKALDEMKQEMVSIASLMAGKVVAASIDTKIQESLIDETLKEMGESTWLS